MCRRARAKKSARGAVHAPTGERQSGVGGRARVRTHAVAHSYFVFKGFKRFLVSLSLSLANKHSLFTCS